jgi:hypothetical protein
MHWNHRIVRTEDEYLGICEVFYEDGKVLAHTDPLPITGEDIEELRETLQHMLDCLDKPILDEMK